MNIVHKIILGVTILIFFILSLITMPDYGVNWDTFQHLARGQDYLQYFITGKTNNNAVESFDGRVSYYEKTDFDFVWANKMTIGHPPLNDILLALSNRVMFKYLGITSDMQGYSLYIVFLVCIGACIIAIWSYELFGFLPALFSVFTYYTYPLLFSEQHFNIKDPAVMVYMSGFLYFFWKGFVAKKVYYIFICSVFLGLSLGTKFNIVFISIVVCIWLIFFFRKKIFIRKRKVSISAFLSSYAKEYNNLFTCAVLSIPLVGFGIFFLTYPALWQNPIANTLSVISYYHDIGGSRCPYYPLTPQWTFKCFDWNTCELIFKTIPISTLIFSFLGFIFTYKYIQKFYMAPLLWSIMLSVTIYRVCFPISVLYGGSLRQIMEIIIPLSLLSAFGMYILLRHQFFRPLFCIGILIFSGITVGRLILLHPNENLYRNEIGLFSSKEYGKKFVNGIVSYGHAYKHGVDWIAMYAEPNAKVSLVTGISSAIPPFLFRQDILYGSKYWSGWEQKGEYLLELVDSGSHVASFFPYRYATRVLRPLYEKYVDGYPIVRVWKNEMRYVYPQFQKETQKSILSISQFDEDEVLLSLPEQVFLKELIIKTKSLSCKQAIGESYILLSEDGKIFDRMYETVSNFAESANDEGSSSNVYYFSGEHVRYIKLFVHTSHTCDLTGNIYELIYFP